MTFTHILWREGDLAKVGARTYFHEIETTYDRSNEVGPNSTL